VKTLESKETKASKEIRVTHNSVFAAHRLQCRMTNRKNRHPAFCLYRKIESEKQELRKREKRMRLRLGYTLFLDPRNVSGRKLPTAIALNESVGELHDSIERFAVRCSFHTRFSQNHGCVTIKAR
jgi:adenylate cyclase